MADRVQIKIEIVPIETLTDENATTHDIIASEVGKKLGGTADSLQVSNYGGAADDQGYLNKTVNYRSASHSAGGTRLTAATTSDVIFIKNTGYKYSNATALGASTTDCVLVAIRVPAQDPGSSGGWETADGTSRTHFLELGWLKPGQAMVLTHSPEVTNGAFGSNNNDLSYLNQIGLDGEATHIYVRTYTSAGAAAASANAVEFLAVV
jgi:hypothetical protein